MFKICLIGYGYWGLNLSRVIDQNFDSQLAIIIELDETKHDSIRKKHPKTLVLSNYKNIEKKEVDAVVICTPISTHFEIAKFFLEKNIHVFCEKPLALKAIEVEELDTLALKYKVKLMVGHIFEFNAVVQRIKKLVSEDDWGDILYISMVRAGLGPVREDVNVVYDLATHDISILNYILSDKPIKVSATGSCFINKNIEDVAFINLEYSNNLKVNILVSWLEAAKERNIKIVGTKKMLVFNDLDPISKLKIYSTGETYQKFTGDFGVFQSSLTDGDILIPNIDYNEPLSQEFSHFINCIKHNLEPLTNAKNALAVVKIIEKIQIALKNDV